jgi:hypothetical protein
MLNFQSKLRKTGLLEANRVVKGLAEKIQNQAEESSSNLDDPGMVEVSNPSTPRQIQTSQSDIDSSSLKPTDNFPKDSNPVFPT